MDRMKKNTLCLWYVRDAEEAAHCCARILPGSAVGAVRRAPADYPSGMAGVVLMVEFTVCGVPCIGLNGGAAFRHSEAFSFQIATDDQAETDHYWNAIVGNDGAESTCGGCKDKWGVPWQNTSRVLTQAMVRGGDVAKRAFEAIMPMRKMDIARINAAVRGLSNPVSTIAAQRSSGGPPSKAQSRTCGAQTMPADIQQWNGASDDWHTTMARVVLRTGGEFSIPPGGEGRQHGFRLRRNLYENVELQRIGYSLGGGMGQVEFVPGRGDVTVRVTFDAEEIHSLDRQRGRWQAILENFARYAVGEQQVV